MYKVASVISWKTEAGPSGYQRTQPDTKGTPIKEIHGRTGRFVKNRNWRPKVRNRAPPAAPFSRIPITLHKVDGRETTQVQQKSRQQHKSHDSAAVSMLEQAGQVLDKIRWPTARDWYHSSPWKPKSWNSKQSNNSHLLPFGKFSDQSALCQRQSARGLFSYLPFSHEISWSFFHLSNFNKSC